MSTHKIAQPIPDHVLIDDPIEDPTPNAFTVVLIGLAIVLIVVAGIAIPFYAIDIDADYPPSTFECVRVGE